MNPNNQVEQPSVTSLLFDDTQNIIWCGDSAGYTRSFTPNGTGMGFEPQLIFPYTKFKSTLDSPVIQYLNHRDGLLTLLQNSISFNNNRGLNKFSLTSESFEDGSKFKDLTCMTINCNISNDVVIGGNCTLLKLDINRPNFLTSFKHAGNISLIKHSSKFLTLGRSNGSVELFDPVSNQSIKTFNGHNGILTDLDVEGNYVATCGCSVRQRRFGGANDFMVDPLVNIYDIRMMRPLAPVSFSVGASFARFHPKLPNIILIASNSGQLQFVDMYDQLKIYLYQADISLPKSMSNGMKQPNSYMSNLEFSKNGEFFAFSDSLSNVHLWSINSSSRDFVSFPAPLEQPDIAAPTPPVAIGVDDVVPLSAIGMPYYKDLLLSNYASDLTFDKELAKVPVPLDTDLLNEGKGKVIPYDKIKYGPRNVVNKYQSLREMKNNSAVIPKFISERDNQEKTAEVLMSEMSDSDSIFQYKTINLGTKSASTCKIPNCYSKIKIQYSKFGVEDFDFSYYNRSQGEYCGLENHVDNSYINSLIQLYRFSPIFYNSITSKLLHEWLPNDMDVILQNPQGSSILNELGYLFDMMYKAKSRNVKISNFSQALSENKIALQENLLNHDDGKNLRSDQLRNLITRFNKFLINQLNQDLYNQFGDLSLQDNLSIQFEIEVSSNSCQLYDKQLGSQMMIDLITPPPNSLNKLSILVNPHNLTTPTITKKNYTLLTYLEYSLNQYKTIPCQQHQYMHNLEIRTTVTKLPPLLAINIAFSDQEMSILNNLKKWLVPEFYSTTGNNNKIHLKPVVTQAHQDITKYDLLGYVCEISRETESLAGSHNLISYVKIQGVWYLFNDFMVMPIPESEVFNLSSPWKKPTILLYQNADDPRNRNFEYFDQRIFKNLPGLNDSILYRDHFSCAIRETHKKEYTLLTREEAPSMGSLYAIDAEFVSLKPERIEISYTGAKSMIDPKILSLARISVLRGDNGPKQGVPCIDDYILHTKPIHDYLTSFSGIEPGDLDPTKSSHNLVTLQTAYRKLWLLLNMGVIFVGHGLQNDFRTINLQVPSQQIRDTAEFFYLSDFKRKLSLKFLAYVLLRENVQTGNHDSIEDANTALLLYKKYLELNAVGEFEGALNRIYMEGQQLRFRVPEK